MSLPAPPVIADTVQALIFDCDGTLADTFAAHYRTFKSALVPYRVEFTTAFYAARLGLSRRQMLAALQAETGVMFDDADVATRTPPIFLQHLNAVKAVPFSETLVRQHHGKLKLAVASAGVRNVVTASLETIGLLGFFDTVVTIEDTGVGKPAPDLFLKAAERLNVTPALCHVFEDSNEGVEAAHRAGMACTDIRPYYTSDPAAWDI
jgi:beta-phosphoglucomutase-like phosphatase (HAD superfamily)